MIQIVSVSIGGGKEGSALEANARLAKKSERGMASAQIIQSYNRTISNLQARRHGTLPKRRQRGSQIASEDHDRWMAYCVTMSQALMYHRTAFQPSPRLGSRLRQPKRLFWQSVRASSSRTGNADVDRTSSLRKLLEKPGLLLVRSTRVPAPLPRPCAGELCSYLVIQSRWSSPIGLR